MTPLRVDAKDRRYDALIGTGGIGTGAFFALKGNHTLGREESRAGRFLDHRDYAKLHIIAHYARVLMGPAFTVLPIGRVGADEAGERLLREMAAVGMDLRHVRALDGVSTMNCICLIYPDGSGGNLTVDDSACTRVDANAVSQAEPEFAAHEGRGVALAVPEVPLESRAALLELATRYRFLRAASFTSEEIVTYEAEAMLAQTDLLVINRDEAAALAGQPPDQDPVDVAKAITAILRPDLQVVMTAGRDGSWAWDGRHWSHQPAAVVEAISAAGAGDAFFAGTLAGLAAGMNLPQAQQLGTLAGAVSVTSPHTIHPSLDAPALATLARSTDMQLPEQVQAVLE